MWPDAALPPREVGLDWGIMASELTRADVDAFPGATVLEFGASWCPICQGARSIIDATLREHENVRHVWIEDGKGKPLGRSFRVKLWPTLVFLLEGREVARVVRPSRSEELAEPLQQINGGRPA